MLKNLHRVCSVLTKKIVKIFPTCCVVGIFTLNILLYPHFCVEHFCHIVILIKKSSVSTYDCTTTNIHSSKFSNIIMTNLFNSSIPILKLLQYLDQFILEQSSPKWPLVYLKFSIIIMNILLDCWIPVLKYILDYLIG